MATIAITVTEGVTAKTFTRDAAEGKIQFHLQRSNGTYRRVHYLPEGSIGRETAEWVLEQREKGRTMRSISVEMHVSIASVRRMINDMLLTREIEEADTEYLTEWLREAEDGS